MFLCLLVYGINGDNREWMPRPEFNVYSWSYWFVLSACFFLLNASKLYLKYYNHITLSYLLDIFLYL